VASDIIVIAAGATFAPMDPRDPQGSLITPNRDVLAKANLPIFEAYAASIALNGAGHEIVLILSNPVELGVSVFSRYIDRRRVIGIGGHSDTLRFRREIAVELGVRRQLVSGFVIGEHGTGMVPAWSTVKVHGLDPDDLASAVRAMRRGTSLADFRQRLVEHVGLLLERLVDDTHSVFAWLDRLPPDLRTCLKPLATTLCGGWTANVSAMVTVDLVKTILTGHEAVVCGQVALDSDGYDLHGPLGVPVVISPEGWTPTAPLELDEEERQLLADASAGINDKIEGWLRGR